MEKKTRQVVHTAEAPEIGEQLLGHHRLHDEQQKST